VSLQTHLIPSSGFSRVHDRAYDRPTDRPRYSNSCRNSQHRCWCSMRCRLTTIVNVVVRTRRAPYMYRQCGRAISLQADIRWNALTCRLLERTWSLWSQTDELLCCLQLACQIQTSTITTQAVSTICRLWDQHDSLITAFVQKRRVWNIKRWRHTKHVDYVSLFHGDSQARLYTQADRLIQILFLNLNSLAAIESWFVLQLYEACTSFTWLFFPDFFTLSSMLKNYWCIFLNVHF